MTDKYGEAKELLRGGYDLHAHSFPSHVSRSVDDFELLEQAAGAGMAGVMIKNHYESTAARAALMNKRSGLPVRAYGGLVLNWPAGGINPYAVECTETGSGFYLASHQRCGSLPAIWRYAGRFFFTARNWAF